MKQLEVEHGEYWAIFEYWVEHGDAPLEVPVVLLRLSSYGKGDDSLAPETLPEAVLESLTESALNNASEALGIIY